jgi:hypothetical protein
LCSDFGWPQVQVAAGAFVVSFFIEANGFAAGPAFPRYDPSAARSIRNERRRRIARRRSFTTLPKKGLEPPRPCGHWYLKPARLPIPPPGRDRFD